MNEIKILGQNVKIKLCDDGEMGDGDYIGRADYNNSLIKVSSHLEIQAQRKSLLHEILHFINHEVAMGLSEKNISKLEAALYAVFQDNPHIFEYKWWNNK